MKKASSANLNQVKIGEKRPTPHSKGIRMAALEAFNPNSVGIHQANIVLPGKRYAHATCVVDESQLFMFGGTHKTGSG